MKNGTINFSGMICYLNDLRVSIEDFKEKLNGGVSTIEQGNGVQIFNLEYKDDNLLISFSDDSAMPRNPKVYDKGTQTLQNNPRKKDQIEPRDYFALIDFKTSFLWLNNTKKKKLLLKFMQGYFIKEKLILKDIYSEHEFINCLKTLDGIKLSAVPANIFAETNTTSKALNDEMYPATKAELILTYNQIRVIDKIKDKIANILHNRISFQNITISGRDEKNLEIFFNNNMFTRKITFKSEIDENGMFISDQVFDELISKIKKETKYENN